MRPVTTYKLLDLGADGTIVGAVTALYALLPVLAALALGRLTDRLRSLRLLILGAGLVLALGAAGIALAQSIALVAVANTVLGLGHLVFTIGGQSAIARYSPPHLLDRGFGWFTAAFAFGQLAGPLVGGVLLGPETSAEGRADAIATALWVGVACAAAVVPVMLVRVRQPGDAGAGSLAQDDVGPDAAPWEPNLDAGSGASAAGAAAGRPTLAAILRTPRVSGLMLSSLALLAMTDILIAFLPLVGEHAGVAPLWVGVLLAVRGAATILSRLLLSWLTARISRTALVMISVFGAGTAFAFVPVAIGELWAAVVVLGLGGLFLGLGQPLTMSLITLAVPAGWTGTALAVRLLGNRVGQVALPLAAGALAGPLGPGAAIWFSVAVLLLSGVEQAAEALTTRRRKP